jgi:hypothetical protein
MRLGTLRPLSIPVSEALVAKRLGIAVFRFLPGGLKGCTMTNTKALAHIVPDKTYPGMWRVVRPDGLLSDMVNKTRAKDVARGLAENAVYLGNAA